MRHEGMGGLLTLVLDVWAIVNFGPKTNQA